MKIPNKNTTPKPIKTFFVKSQKKNFFFFPVVGREAILL
jgi:hypothetical protein